ncbi:MAG: sulfatase [Myxococcota bacterium]
MYCHRVIAALLFGLGLACGPPKGPAADVLLITVDTLRPDYLSMNGYDRATTPKLDRILADSLYFDQATSPIARTTPALASLLTGAYPHRTGVRTLTGELASDVTTLTEILRGDGYQTLAVVSNQVLVRARGLSRGFDTYDMAADDRDARATTNAVLEHLQELDPSDPTFVWVHYIDPHVPYHTDPAIVARMDPGYTGRYRFNFGWMRQLGEPRDNHQPFPEDLPKQIAAHRNPLSDEVNAHIRRLYAADIRALDSEIDRLVDAARERFGDDLIIVFTADHGESLGEHDFYFDHGDYVYNASTRVPLAILLPKSHPLHATGRCTGWVSLTDVAPTLLEIHGRDAAELGTQLEGRSLSSCLRGEGLAQEPIFSESGHSFFGDLIRGRTANDLTDRFRSVTLGDWKLIWSPSAAEPDAWQLFDLREDPDETRNLFHPGHPKIAKLRSHLDAWLAREPASDTQRAIDDEDRRALAELGYIESETPANE